jgi:hypothetical protein
MPKEFYTEKDIEDLFNRGIKSLYMTENVVLTELAYEKAKRLDFQLVSEGADNPPAAPVRPYLAESPRRQTAHAKPIVAPVSPNALTQPQHASTALPEGSLRSARENAIEQRIRSAVIARLGNQVDAKLLDNIIHRVVKGIGLK